MILRMRKAHLEAQVEALRSELASLTQQQFTQLMCQRGKLSVFRSQLTHQSLHLSLLAKYAIPVACFLFHLFLFRSFNDLFIHYALSSCQHDLVLYNICCSPFRAASACYNCLYETCASELLVYMKGSALSTNLMYSQVFVSLVLVQLQLSQQMY